MIQIYSVNNTNYEKNGDALLPSSASVHVILNGAWEAELVHPIDREGRWKSITEESVIKMPSFNGDQLFRIKAVEKQDSGVTATMEPIFYDSMNDCFLEDIRPNGDNGQAALTKMLSPNNKYSASSNITKTATAYYQYVNFLEALNGDLDQSFIKRWGGEILFDNYTVIVNNHVGGDYGAELRYGKNIPKNGMSFDVDNRDIVTRIYPKAYEGRMMSNNGYVDSPLINNYPTVKVATMTFENVKLSSDLQGDPEDTDIVCDSQAELDQTLEEMCEAQFSAGLDKPKVTISVDMVLLQNTEQYKDVKNLEEVSLGDTVRIYNRHLGIMSEARIIELEYDAIRKKVSSVVIGDYEYNYFNDVSSATEIIKNVVNPDGTLMAERVQGILNGIYTQLRLQSTAAQKVDGVAFKVEELDDESPLYGCMIWGTQGIQISTTRTADGKDWDWTTAITAKGIVANAIITGLLSDKTGNNYWDLDTGEFRLSSTYVKIDGDNIGDYVDSTLTQQEVFNKLTNNGVAKGLYLTADNELYINATYIKTGIITDNIGNNYWNLATGEFRLSSTATVGGNAIATKNNTISNVDVEYASGESNTTPPTSGWATTAPDWQEGRYIWQRTVTTMQDGTQNISDPTCIQGAAGQNGEAGATGIGVSQIIEQYYLSTSSTTQTGGSWSTAQPAWEKGKYIWTRSKITWTDNSVTHTDPVLAKAINGANEAVDDLDTSLDQQEVFNRLTNNGQAQGIILQNGQLYINAEYIQSLILKVGGVNNENGTFEVYNGSGVLVGKIDKDGAKFTNGNDWLQIKNSLMTGGYGGTTDGLLDLSANYSGGERHVVLESKTGDVILKSSGDFLVERTGTGQGTLLQSGNYQYLTDVGDVEISSSETEELRAIALGESVARDASNNPIDALALIRKDTLSKVFYEGDYFSYFSSHIITGWRFVSLSTPTTIAPGYTWDLTANAAGSGIPYRTGTEYLVIPVSTGWGAVGSIDQPTSAYGQGSTNFTVTLLNNGSNAHTIGCTCLVLGLLSRDLSPLA